MKPFRPSIRSLNLVKLEQITNHVSANTANTLRLRAGALPSPPLSLLRMRNHHRSFSLHKPINLSK